MSMLVVAGVALLFPLGIVSLSGVVQFIWLALNAIDSISVLVEAETRRDNVACLSAVASAWIVWLAVTTLDSISSPILSWIPFFWLYRPMIYCFFMLCRTMMSNFIVGQILAPILQNYEPHIDTLLSFIRHVVDFIFHYAVRRPLNYILPAYFSSMRAGRDVFACPPAPSKKIKFWRTEMVFDNSLVVFGSCILFGPKATVRYRPVSAVDHPNRPDPQTPARRSARLRARAVAAGLTDEGEEDTYPARHLWAPRKKTARQAAAENNHVAADAAEHDRISPIGIVWSSWKRSSRHGAREEIFG